ncbi:13956_t:CDS:2 [Dentiscutata erythropus]|uniref:13956_t:CDS:1 n=1 Tax=Dentiscutata erythropus TaxID=1348616 RepID=A0A9N8VS08_9GLOM|nr:13956_t:CDS:2 [Dentiscutata erythropus]
MTESSKEKGFYVGSSSKSIITKSLEEEILYVEKKFATWELYESFLNE